MKALTHPLNRAWHIMCAQEWELLCVFNKLAESSETQFEQILEAQEAAREVSVTVGSFSPQHGAVGMKGQGSKAAVRV